MSRGRMIRSSRMTGAAALVERARLATAALLLALSACTVRAYPPTIGGYATVYASDVPADIYAYPRAPYAGGYAYLVHDEWYYPSRGGWVVLQGEPGELHRYRSTVVTSAPPAYRGEYYGRRRDYRQEAPPASYGYPPPAVRVR